MQRRNSAFFFLIKNSYRRNTFTYLNLNIKFSAIETVLFSNAFKKRKKEIQRYLSKPNFKNLLNLSTRINRYIYFSSISIILAVLLEALRDISLFPSLRKPTHSHVLHRNKTFNSRIHAFIYGIRCIRTCKIYIYTSLKRRRAISFSVCFRVRNFAILIIARGASCAV